MGAQSVAFIISEPMHCRCAHYPLRNHPLLTTTMQLLTLPRICIGSPQCMCRCLTHSLSTRASSSLYCRHRAPCALSEHGLTTAVATSGTCMAACVCIHLHALGDLPKQMRRQCRGGNGACCSCFNQPMISDMKCCFHCLAVFQSGYCMGVGNFQLLRQ
jgi:hypothetical protein